MTTTPRVFDICGPLPTGTTLLEASAGTGKTWTIAALVTRYVAEGRARLAEMLVVTFGRAASQELRERVRLQLVAAERALTDVLDGIPDEPPDTLIAQLIDVGADELRARRDRLREALTDFDAATIATTHQFCQLVLRSLGVAGDSDAGATLVEDLDDLLVEVVDDLYVRGFARADEEPVFDRRTALSIARAAVTDPQARLEPTGAEERTPAYRRHRFACAVRAEMEVRKRRLGVLSYDDLLSRLAEALADDGAPARARMRDRWTVVLVDEFQDTDPVQWQVLHRAFNGHATMVLIGDPKQAIYAFRGGDVATYLGAQATATDEATLGINHRSDAPLLASIQAVLGGAALGDERIVVRDVQAAHAGVRLAGVPHPAPLRLRMVDRDRFGVKPGKSPAVGLLRAFVAEDLARDVRALLGSGATFCDRPLVAGDVAVLCRTRPQCEIVRSTLEGVGIPAVIAGSGSVYSTPGADDWLVVLEAMEQPHRSARVRAAALTAFFGRTAEELEHRGDALTEEVAEELRDWAELLRRRGVAAVFEAATARGLPARVLGQQGGERLMTDLRHVAESLHDAGVRERLGLVALLTWMRERVAQAKLDVTGERTRRLDSDAAAVQIVTIHGSKGLEYPVVYLPFVADRWVGSPDHPLFHTDEGTRCRYVGGSGRDADPDAQRRAAAEEAGEDLRLLYVAMTRAHSQLVTWWFASAKNTGPSSWHRMLFGRGPGQSVIPEAAPVPDDDTAVEIARRWESVGGPVVERVVVEESAPVTRPAVLPDLAARHWTREVDQAWRRTSYTALSSATEEQPAALASEPEESPREDEPESPVPVDATALHVDPVRSPMAGLPVGATFGSLVHGVLEHVDPGTAELRDELIAEIRRELVRWPVPLDVEELADALVEVCTAPLGPLAEGTSLRELGDRNRMCELDFELPLAGGDERDYGRSRATLAELAPLLREHLPQSDPLRPYAEVLAASTADEQLLHGYLIGSLDVVLRVGDRYLVVDYKTNWLGGPDELTVQHYRPAVLAEAMRHSSYPLQALLYAVVLHRFLRWRLRDYDPEQHLGGVLYLYVRGMAGPDTPIVDGEPCGVFSWRPPVSLVEAVSGLLDGRALEAVR